MDLRTLKCGCICAFDGESHTDENGEITFSVTIETMSTCETHTQEELDWEQE